MIRGDQHVDDWAEVAVDYLDGRLDPETRLVVESHLAGCPDCSARLRRQQSVVRLLQEAPFYDPPEELEYRAIGEIVFPSPGGRPLATPVAAQKPSRAPGWYRALRGWIPATVAVIALVAALTGYGIARSGSGTTNPAADSERTAGGITTMAAGATTAAPQATTTAAGAAATTAGATTTAVAAAGPPPSEATPSTFAATQDRRSMISALETSQIPAYVSFRRAAATPVSEVQVTTTTGAATADTAATATETAAGTGVTAGTATSVTPAAEPTTVPNGAVTVGTVSPEEASDIVSQLQGFSGLIPLDQSLWLDGPTFAVFLPRQDAEELVDMVRSIGASLGLIVRLEASPPAAAKASSESLMEHKKWFPVLEAARALQPATWGYDFTTSTLVPPSGGQSGTGSTTPDQAGTHVIVVIWIAE